jgi:hypothetical protein
MKKNILLIASLSISLVVNAQTTYKDVAPIFIAKCMSCHRAGGIQFPLTSYTDITNNLGGIQNDIQTGKMPPWSPDTSYSRFTHERVLTATQVNTIVNWINAGAPAGDTTLAPPVPIFGGTQLAGNPDLIVQIPTFTSASAGTDQYVCISVPTNLIQDRYLRAYELVPGNPAIVHHAVVNIDTTATIPSDFSGTCVSQGGQFSIGDFAPGSAPVVFPGVVPVKFGIRIKAGSNVIFQMHYPAGTAGQLDSTQIRMYFYPVNEPNIRPMYNETVIQTFNFFILPYTTKTVTASHYVGNDISLFSIFPHSHKRCVSILNYATNGSTTIPLCKINKWDFDWQGFYTYNNLIKIPAGYSMYGKHTYDNTANNPNNPNPAQLVTGGLFTNDEMLFDGIIFSNYQAGDELVDIGTILSNDSLFVTTNKNNVGKYNPLLVNVKAYPNPFTENITLSYALTEAKFVRVAIFNSEGKEVAKLSSGIQSAGNYTYTWDGKDDKGIALPNDTYIYKIQAGKSTVTGKILLKTKN